MFALLFSFSSAAWDKTALKYCSRLRSGGFVKEVDFPTQEEAETACMAYNDAKTKQFGPGKKACYGIYVRACDMTQAKPYRLCKGGMKKTSKGSCAFFPEGSAEEKKAPGFTDSTLAGILGNKKGKDMAAASQARYEKEEAERQAKREAEAAAAAAKLKKMKADAEERAATAHHNAYHNQHYSPSGRSKKPEKKKVDPALRALYGKFHRHVCTRLNGDQYTDATEALEACNASSHCVAVGRMCKRGKKYILCMKTDSGIKEENRTKGPGCRLDKKSATTK